MMSRTVSKRFRAFLVRTSAWLLALGDGAKLIGIALWATFLIGTALVDVSRAVQRPAE